MKVVLMVFFFMMISSFIFASENPFFMDSSLPFHAPAFDMISINHYLPAFEAGMKQQKEEIAQIISNPQEATFENTIEAMEKTGAILTRVDQVFFNMTSANSNPEIQRIQAEIAPKLSRHSDDIYLNSDFFKRVKSLYEQKHKIHLSVEQQKLLEEYYQRFIRAGAMLTESQKNRVKEINAELSSLSTQFQTNILGITLERSVILDDKKELAGLSDIQIAGPLNWQNHAGMKESICSPLQIQQGSRLPCFCKIEMPENEFGKHLHTEELVKTMVLTTVKSLKILQG